MTYYVMFDTLYFVALVLLDFFKAFDNIDHLLMRRKLESRYGFSSSAVSFLSSYLSLRFQSVFSGNRFSDLLPVNVGVPQRSVLGLLLFPLLIDDPCGAVFTSSYHLYADDFQVYTRGRSCDISDCIHRLNVDLEAIFRWSVENGLSLNSRKAQAMIKWIRAGCRICCLMCECENLSLTMDNRLSWCDQANCAGRDVGFVMSRQLAYMTPVMMRKSLFKLPISIL
jgi:hypothetical protein